MDLWSFDIFELYDATKGELLSTQCLGRPLFYLGMHLYELYNFKSLYQIDETTMAKFLEKVESGYRVCQKS